jgi:hypothetical protein
MAGGLSQSAQQTALDAVFPTSGSGQAIGYSTTGTTEAALLARTAIGATGWAAATAATPSVKANNAALTSAAATGGGTVTHFAVFSATSAGTQLTDWTALSASRTLATGDQLTWAIGSCSVTLD